PTVDPSRGEGDGSEGLERLVPYRWVAHTRSAEGRAGHDPLGSAAPNAALSLQGFRTAAILAGLPIQLESSALKAFCERWGIVELALFGSVLREDFTSESDVDVLARFASDARPTLFELVRAARELGELVGRRVDLVDVRSVERSPN